MMKDYVITKIHVTDDLVILPLLDLQMAAYRVEAELIGLDVTVPLTDSQQRLIESGETFYGYYVKGTLLGAISYKKQTGNILEICRLMVHPKHFRRGIGRTLLTYILSVERGIEKAIVMVGSNNAPALNLYRQQGFVEVSRFKYDNCVWMSRLEKNILSFPSQHFML